MPAIDQSLPGAPAATPAVSDGDINLPQFVRGVREFYLGMMHGHLAPPQFDSARAVDAAWLTNLVLASQGQRLPVAPQVDMTGTELEAFNRFCECVEDGEQYDVSKHMMGRLADIGLVRAQGFGRYTLTSYGQAIRALAKG